MPSIIWYDKEMRVVGCFLEYNNTFALLYRHVHKPDGATWGLPAGKVEVGESDSSAMIRELFEETGCLASVSQLEPLGEYDFVMPSGTKNTFVTYRLNLVRPHDIVLEASSHANYTWVSAAQAYAMPDLIFGLHDVIKMVGFVK
jgi:8-oxo-dGTP pyrophosphatase MutT (NUDIX family)